MEDKIEIGECSYLHQGEQTPHMCLTAVVHGNEDRKPDYMLLCRDEERMDHCKLPNPEIVIVIESLPSLSCQLSFHELGDPGDETPSQSHHLPAMIVQRPDPC